MIEKAKRTNKNAYIVSLMLFLLSLLSFAYSTMKTGSESLFGFLGFLFMLIFFCFSKRYIGNRYAYCLTPTDEMYLKNDFTVVRSFGKSETVVCNISLYDVTDVIRTKNGKELLKALKGIKRVFDYSSDFLFKRAVIIKLSENGTETAVIIQCSDAFFSELKLRVQ